MNSYRIVLFAMSLSGVSVALAHPGHGVAGHGNEVLHSMFGSEHALLLGAIGIAGLLWKQRLGRGPDDGE